MNDEPTSEHMRKRALTYIDPRGRPSKPGPSRLELAVEEERMRDEVEGYARNGGFEHWKLDGGGTMNRVNTVVEVPPDLPPPSSFSATTMFDPFVFAVEDGQFFVYEPSGAGTSEPLETAIPKLEAILGAARLAANSA
jgi:hypothetical protein